MSKITVTQTRSLIATKGSQRLVIEGLGLGRIGKSRTHKDNNCIRGMINKVQHLVEYKLHD